MTTLTNAQKSKLLNEAVDLINRADALVQQALEAGDKCYAIHNAIQDVAEDVAEEADWADMLEQEWS